jgi:hypothetical protein
MLYGLGLLRYLYVLDRLSPEEGGIGPLIVSFMSAIIGAWCASRARRQPLTPHNLLLWQWLLGACIGAFLFIQIGAEIRMNQGKGIPDLDGRPLLAERERYVLQSHGIESLVSRQEFVLQGFYELVSIGNMTSMFVVLTCGILLLGNDAGSIERKDKK